MNSLEALELGFMEPDPSAINSFLDSKGNGSFKCVCVCVCVCERERERERERSGFAEWEVVFVGLKSNKRVYLAFHFFKNL